MGKESDQCTTKKMSDMLIRIAGNKYMPFGVKTIKDCDEYYPDCGKKTYRVPPRIVKFKRVEKQTETDNTKPDEEYSILKEANADNAKGKYAESLILDALEDLKNMHDKEQPMFIISNYDFENYLNEVKTELGSRSDIFPQKTGEHDILFLHLQHGVVFIQVKSIEEVRLKSDKKPRDNHNKKIRERVEEGLSQLDRDVEMFKHIMKDLDLNIPITKVLALPNISKRYISTLTTSKKLLQDKLGDNALDICLFRDQININENEGKELLLEWWKRNISTKLSFRDANEYKQVIGRYVGLMSTVKIRTFGDVISEEGYQNMRIVLTAEQVEVLRSSDRKMYIQGTFGTGKTILLILKAREMVKKGQSVLMVCGKPIKLLAYLVACVKAYMTEKQKLLVHCITDYGEHPSQTSFEQHNIFVDECSSSVVSYFMDCCWENSKLCWLAGRYEPHIKILNVKHLSKVLRSSDTIKATCDELDKDMLYDFVKLNNFPIIDHSRHKKSKNELLFDGSTIWRCHQCWKEVKDILVQCRLIPVNAVRHDPQASPNGEVKNTKCSNTSTTELKTLVEAQHPLTWSDIAILIPSLSVITDADIEAIDQVSTNNGIPLNYYLLKKIEAVKNKADVDEWTQRDDEHILLGKKNQIVIALVSQFIGLERKIIIAAGWDNLTTKADNVSAKTEILNCEASISHLDAKSILADPYLSNLVLYNLKEYHLFSNIVEPRSVLSQLLLQMVDSYTDKSNNCNGNITRDKMHVHMLCCLKLLTIICDVSYYSSYKTEVSQLISVPTENVSEINSGQMKVKFADILNAPMSSLCSHVFNFTWSNIINSLSVAIKTMKLFLSRGKLADISTDVGKIACFHCAISRSTSQVYIWN